MDFKETQPIYMQIAEWVYEQILLGRWKPEDRASSVRDLSARLEVNLNTVARSYEFLENKEILVNKRGVGFFIAPNAADKIRNFRRERFFTEELPAVFKTMRLLGIGMEEIALRF
jgi:DNA-binding transcriptional regulator YhcF (GntR family)